MKRLVKKSLACLLTLTLVISMVPAMSFAANGSDIKNHWAEKEINNLAERGVIQGYPDGKFMPDKTTTRAEFMTMVNKAFQFTEPAEINFSDVKAGAWYEDAVKAAKKAGYISGYPDGTMQPDKNITRQEVASIMLILNNLVANATAADVFKDSASIPSWSKGAVGAVLEAKIMAGYPDNTFRALQNITRAEVAVILYKNMDSNTEADDNVVPPVNGNTSGGGSTGGQTQDKSADMVLKNGVIYSVNGVAKGTKATISQAVALKDGKITYVGTDKGVAAYIGADTLVTDLEGKMVLPGFVDAHAHGKAMAANIFDLSLYSMNPAEPMLDEIISAVEDWIGYRKGMAQDPNWEPEYILGNGWDTLKADALVAAGTALNAALEAIAPGIPVVLYDASHHQAWANNVAISEAGISADTPNPPGGVIGRNPDNTPNGLFQEDSGIGLVLSAIPYNTVEENKAGILAYQAMVNSFGITLNQDPQLTENTIEAYKQLAEAGDMTIRTRAGYLLTPIVNEAGDAFVVLNDSAEALAAEAQLDQMAIDSAVKHTVGDLFQMNFVKIYGDGGGPTTFMKGVDYPEGGSPNVWPQDQLNYVSEKLVENGVQIHCHSMGDAALSGFLDAFELAQKGATDVSKFRNSITHLQYVDDGNNDFDGSIDDAARMARLGVIGIPQPFWMIKDPYFTMYWPWCGKERTEACYPMKTLVDAGVIMAGGSDWPVTQPNSPLTSIQTGITRTLPYDDPAIAFTPDMARNPMYRTPLGPVGNVEKDMVDLKTMIQSVTINGAYAMFLEDVTGSIQVGKSADMVVLDKDLRTVNPADIGKTNVMMTIFKGDVVYQATEPTVKEHDFVSFVPVYPGNPAPYFLVAGPPMTAGDFKATLNPAVDGTIEIHDGSDNLVGDESALDPGMKVVSEVGGIITEYPIVIPPPPAFNSFEQIEIENSSIAVPNAPPEAAPVISGCAVIKLANPLPGLTSEDVYLLRTEENISPMTIEVVDVSDQYTDEEDNPYDADSGNVYLIKALDPEIITIPFVGPVLSYQKPLDGEYSIWVYSPIAGPLSIFVNSGEVMVDF